MKTHLQIKIEKMQPGHIQERRKPFVAKLPPNSPLITEFDPRTVTAGQSLFFAA